jgi:DNA-binding GntR family transcriptional regulator
MAFPNAGTLELKTVEEQVVESLRERIIRGSLQPGDSLPLEELSVSLGVSTMPVRHALRRLEAERLVVQLPRRGASVALLDIEDLEEIQAIRSGLEGLAAREGVKRLTDESIKETRAHLKRLRSAARRRELEEFLAAQWELHDGCYRASGRPRLMSLLVEHRRRAERYIRYALTTPEGFAASFDHQVRFQDACEKRDSRAAEACIRRAMAWTVDAVSRALPVSPA